MLTIPYDTPLKISTKLPKYFHLTHNVEKCQWLNHKPSKCSVLYKFGWRCNQNDIVQVYLTATKSFYQENVIKQADVPDTIIDSMMNQLNISFMETDTTNVIAISNWMLQHKFGYELMRTLSKIICENGVVTRSYSVIIWYMIAFNKFPTIEVSIPELLGVIKDSVELDRVDYFYKDITMSRIRDIPKLIVNLVSNQMQLDQLWSIHLRTDYCTSAKESSILDHVIQGWLIRIMENNKNNVWLRYGYNGHDFIDTETIKEPVITSLSVDTEQLWKETSKVTHLDIKILKIVSNQFRLPKNKRHSLKLRKNTKEDSIYLRVWQSVEPLVEQIASQILG